MKICRLIIKDYLQFKNIDFDFRNPDTLEPLDKICLIGRNGTGKTNLLKLLDAFLSDFQYVSSIKFSFLLIEVQEKEGNNLYILRTKLLGYPFIFKKSIDENQGWIENMSSHDNSEAFLSYIEKKYRKYCLNDTGDYDTVYGRLVLRYNSSDIVVYSPSESHDNTYLKVNDVPVTSVNTALPLLQHLPFHHIVSSENVTEFWTILVYLIKRRDNEREVYENKTENINKTKKQLIEEFDNLNPKILDKLSEVWNKILGRAGLEFDIENASNPIQLNDNLKAYIRLKKSKEKINYSQLSTGIRNFIFRVGHIYSLYFNRKIEKGFLLIDEPENSLFPDFLFDLVETYVELIKDAEGGNNTQLFIATHSPIIAAQFQPYERIILDWDEDGGVKARKGSAPVGDDPNGILTQDFELTNLMGKEGLKVWEKYVELKKSLKREQDPLVKEKILSQINSIGGKYNF